MEDDEKASGDTKRSGLARVFDGLGKSLWKTLHFIHSDRLQWWADWYGLVLVVTLLVLVASVILGNAWLSGYGTAVQAAAAVAQLIAPGVLVGVTIWYATSAKQQVAQAARQVDETREQTATLIQEVEIARMQVIEAARTRKQLMQPVLVIRASCFQKRVTPTQQRLRALDPIGLNDKVPVDEFTPEFQVVNVGSGPALSVMMYYTNTRFGGFSSTEILPRAYGQCANLVSFSVIVQTG